VVSWGDSRSRQAFHRAWLLWGGSATVLTHANHAGLHEYIRWKLENISGFRENPALLFSALGGLSTYYSFFWMEYPRCYTTTLRILLHAGAPLDIPLPVAPTQLQCYNDGACLVGIWHVVEYLAGDKALHPNPKRKVPATLAGWMWLVVLPSIVDTLIFSTISHKVTFQFWEFLEVWLEFGATPPLDIVYSEPESPRSEGSSPVEEMAVRYKVPIHSKYRDGVTVVESGFRCKAVSESLIVGRLGTSKRSSFADLVKSHRPQNAGILLGYIDRNLAVMRGKMKGQTSVEEI
jgi:hypothetical protein